MENHKNNPHKRQGKDNRRATQLKTIFHFLENNDATASMVEAATGVHQKCITRYKRDLEKAGLLWETRKALCKHTGFRAWYLTTNPKKAPSTNQLNLFE